MHFVALFKKIYKIHTFKEYLISNSRFVVL
jgi:hypothetical protein